MSPADALAVAAVVALSLAGLSLVLHGLRVGISPMPTSPEVRSRLLGLVPADTSGTILELGSGWGGLAFSLADRCPKARVLAFESSPVPHAVAALRQRLRPRANLELRRADFLREPLSGAPLVVCFLSTGLMARLGPKLQRELGPEAQVLTVTFALRGWRPEEVHFADDLFRSPIYRYRVGAATTAPDSSPRAPGAASKKRER